MASKSRRQVGFQTLMNVALCPDVADQPQSLATTWPMLADDGPSTPCTGTPYLHTPCLISMHPSSLTHSQLPAFPLAVEKHSAAEHRTSSAVASRALHRTAAAYV